MKHTLIKTFVTFSIAFTILLALCLPGWTKVFGMFIVPASFFTGIYLVAAVSPVAATGWQYVENRKKPT